MKLQNIKLFFSKWERSNFETYRLAYNLYGGSVCTHPDVLQFLSKASGVVLEFYCKMSQGRISGACYSVKGRLSLQNKRFPLVFDDVLFPCSEEGSGFLPFNTKRLSPGHKGNFFNVVHSGRLKHKITYIKNSFSKSTEKKRNGELNKFLREGGEVKDVHDFAIEDIARFYITLFQDRWQNKLECFSYSDLCDTLKNLHHLLFGCVLIKNGEVCALDIIFKSEAKDFIYFDDINGGYSSAYPEYNLGTILLWANIQKARELCQDKQKVFRFSLGIYLEHWSYKKQWCDIIPLGRTLI